MVSCRPAERLSPKREAGAVRPAAAEELVQQVAEVAAEKAGAFVPPQHQLGEDGQVADRGVCAAQAGGAAAGGHRIQRQAQAEGDAVVEERLLHAERVALQVEAPDAGVAVDGAVEVVPSVQGEEDPVLRQRAVVVAGLEAALPGQEHRAVRAEDAHAQRQPVTEHFGRGILGDAGDAAGRRRLGRARGWRARRAGGRHLRRGWRQRQRDGQDLRRVGVGPRGGPPPPPPPYSGLTIPFSLVLFLKKIEACWPPVVATLVVVPTGERVTFPSARRACELAHPNSASVHHPGAGG